MPQYDIHEIYSQMEQHIIASMKRNLMRHNKEQEKYGIEFTQWQAAKLKELRRFRKENKAIIGGATKRLPKDIQQHLLNEYRQGLVGVIKKHKEKFGDTTLTRDLSDGFFGTNDKKIQALIDAVNNDLQAANHAALRMANDAYRQTIHKAAMFAANGVMTEKQAIEMAIHEFAKRGLNCIKYSNGARHNIKEYAEMALRTAETRAMLMGEGKARQELGETLVQITKHGTACPLCVPFEGKVLIDDVYSGGTWENSKEAYEKVPQAKRAGVRFMSEAMKQGLYHPRCRHGLGTFYIELLEDEKPALTQQTAPLQAVQAPGSPAIPVNTQSDVYQKYGDTHYTAIHGIINMADQRVKDVWAKMEPRLSVIDAHSKAHPHYSPVSGGIHLDINRDAKGSHWQKPYSTLFHEHGHNIDYLASKKPYTAFSTEYNNGEFETTILDEINGYIKSIDTRMKAEYKAHATDYEWLKNNGYISQYNYDYYVRTGRWMNTPKYSKSMAYIAFEKELKQIPGVARADMSDIVEGATKAKVKAGFGHGASYWKSPGKVAKEAFAEMFDATMNNPDSLATLKQYLPRSYKVFMDMLDEIIKI